MRSLFNEHKKIFLFQYSIQLGIKKDIIDRELLELLVHNTLVEIQIGTKPDFIKTSKENWKNLCFWK